MRKSLPVLLAVALMLCAFEAFASTTAGTIRCKETTHTIEKAKIQLEPDGQSVRVELFKPGKADYFAALDVSVERASNERATSEVSYYHFYAQCPEMQYNVNRTVGKGFGEHDDFSRFLAELRIGGAVQIQVAGNEPMFDGLTWNLDVSGSID